MNETRETVRKELARIKPLVVTRLKTAQKDWTLYGKEISFSVNHKEKRAVYYSAGRENAPVYFDIHGGGFCWGSMFDGNFFCHELAQQLGINVFSLNYPLGPDNVYPSQLEDLEETIVFIREHPQQFHIDPSAPAIGGRSAGANLATALCLRMKNIHFRVQVLDHPWLDLSDVIPESERYVPQGINMLDALKNLKVAYADEEQRRVADVSPILAEKEALAALPPAVIQTCSLDVLKNDGDLYAQKLKEAGVTVIHHTVKGAKHGFSEYATPLGEQGRKWLIESIGRFY